MSSDTSCPKCKTPDAMVATGITVSLPLLTAGVSPDKRFYTKICKKCGYTELYAHSR